jgi:hypothetical protein
VWFLAMVAIVAIPALLLLVTRLTKAGGRSAARSPRARVEVVSS